MLEELKQKVYKANMLLLKYNLLLMVLYAK